MNETQYAGLYMLSEWGNYWGKKLTQCACAERAGAQCACAQCACAKCAGIMSIEYELVITAKTNIWPFGSFKWWLEDTIQNSDCIEIGNLFSLLFKITIDHLIS